MARRIDDLRNALGETGALTGRIAGRQPVVFLDYDGTLTPIRDRPQEAVISNSMRKAVQRLAERVTVIVVSGRDREVVQRLMGLDNLVVAGDHGFDIWSPTGGSIQHEEGASFEDLLREVETKLRAELASIPGILVEPKKFSVAVHDRLVPKQQRPRVKEIVDATLGEYPQELKVTPGKMVFEIQPRLDWDKGQAVLYLLRALRLDRDDVVPIDPRRRHHRRGRFSRRGGARYRTLRGERQRPRGLRPRHRRGLRAGHDWGGGGVPQLVCRFACGRGAAHANWRQI